MTTSDWLTGLTPVVLGLALIVYAPTPYDFVGYVLVFSGVGWLYLLTAE